MAYQVYEDEHVAGLYRALSLRFHIRYIDMLTDADNFGGKTIDHGLLPTRRYRRAIRCRRPAFGRGMGSALAGKFRAGKSQMTAIMDSAPPPLVTISGTNTTSCIVSGINTMSVADIRSFLARHCSPSALRRRMLDQRDNVIRQLAAHYTATSGRALADALRRDLLRYAASAYRFERKIGRAHV